MSNTNMSFNSARIRELAEKIRTNTAEIDEELKKLENLCGTVQFSWKDKNSTMYVNKVDQKKSQLLTVNNDFKNFATLLDKYATSMEQKEQNISEEGNKL